MITEYYSLDKLLSRNSVFNIVVGPRGNGKTYSAKKLVIKKAIQNGDEFVYLRRYQTEIKGLGTWFGDVSKEFPEYVFRVNGKYAQMKLAVDADNKDIPWQTIGYFLCLSKSQQYKSVPFPKVKWLLFDEFIIEQGYVHYLPNEVKAFLDMYSTIDRWQDRVRCILMGNSISVMNPYFLEWEIHPEDGVEFIAKNDGFITAQFCSDELFRDQVYQSRFGNFIRETDYGDYSAEGTFKDNSGTMIAGKPPEYRYMYSILGKQGSFSVWFDEYWRGAHISDKQPASPTWFVLDPKLMAEDRTLVDSSFKLFAMVRGMFSRGQCSFSSPQARNLFIELWRK